MPSLKVNQELVNAIKKEILNSVYPINSIYITANPINPSKIFGGTWTQLKSAFLYAASDSSHVRGDTGNIGSGAATNGHSITVDQMPAHAHSAGLNNGGGHQHIMWFGGGANSGNGGQISVANQRWGQDVAGMSTGDHDHGGVWVANSGGGKSHAHNIPWIAVIVWKRTA